MSDTSCEDLFDKLLGRWDPNSLKFEKYDDIMSLMEASIGLGGGPVRGVNFTSRVKDISTELITVLGGKPSFPIVTTTCLTIYRIKTYVEKMIRFDDPLTGGKYTPHTLNHNPNTYSPHTQVETRVPKSNVYGRSVPD